MSIPGLRIGDAIRLRDAKHRGRDGVSYVAFKPDQQKSKKNQEVFVCLLLGTEPLVLDDEDQELDIKVAMAELGWHPETMLEELVEALKDSSLTPSKRIKKALELLKT